MQWIHKGHDYLKTCPVIKFIVIITLLTYLIVLPMIPLLALLEVDNIGDASNIKQTHWIVELIVVVGVAPLFETLIFQSLVFKVLLKADYFNKRRLLVIIISAIFFGLAHTYSLLYILYGFLIGIILAYAYNIYSYKKISAFWVVTGIHALRNAISFLIFIVDH